MECPHLADDCKINTDLIIKAKKCQLIDSCSGTNNEAITPGGNQKVWKCTDCDSTMNNWLCLFCGGVYCGRYENAHGLNHFNTVDHKVCINTLNYSIYCYKCDDFIVNEIQEIEEIRHALKIDDDASSETSSTPTIVEEASLLSAVSVKSSSSSSSTTTSTSSSTTNSNSQETASISSNDSGWEEPKQVVSGRKLRPRKRTNSCDSNEGIGALNMGAAASKRKTPRKSKMQHLKVLGLRNLGNTCFMNSVLQSLNNIQEFSCYFSALPSLEIPVGKKKRIYHSRSIKENVNEANVVEELRKVLMNLNKGGDNHNKAISPECLFLVIWKVVPQFRGHRQHDAHEFLRYMLDRLHTELQHLTIDTSDGLLNGKISSPPLSVNSLLDGASSGAANSNYSFRGGKSSIVTSVFGGTLQSEVRCLVCGMESKKHDPFLDLSLDIPEKFFKDNGTAVVAANNAAANIADADNGGGGDAKANATRPVCNIIDCLASFTEVESLSDTEYYFCSSCKRRQNSTKRFWVKRLPNVLCLHIKRFRWSNFFRTKIDLRISFPIKNLDMSPYCLSNGPETRRNSNLNNVYDLAAVIVHHGNGSSCGHYTAYAINNGRWLHFNDHTVKEVSVSVVADCKPYILFYTRRELSQSTASSSTAAAGNINCNINKT